jgi:hypothetical protein
VKLVRLDKKAATYLEAVAKEKHLSEAQFLRDLLDDHQRKAEKGGS